MKKSKSKKVLSLVMAIMMILSALPTAIFTIAADTELPMIKAFVTVNGDYHAYRKQIVTATFLDEIDTSDALYSWDVSENGDESVMAWMKVNEAATADAGETRYNLFIGGDGGVFANPNSDDLFFGFEVLKEVNGLENFDTSKVETFKYTFQQCYAIEHLDLSSFDTSSARSFLWMFADCNSLETLDLTGWETSKVTNMNSMFKNCFLITELDISSFDTCSVTDMGNMFYNCKKLTNLYVGEGWNIDNVKNGSSAFNCCEALPGYDKSKHDIGFAEEFVKPESEKPQPEKEKYTVNYEFNGDIPANVTVPTTATYEEGTTVTVEATPSADGYIFSGWTTADADITNGSFEIQNDVTIIGEWTKINYYNVEYKFEGDIPASVTVPTTATYEEGTTVTVETTPSAEGYIFSGWTTSDADITNGSFNVYNNVVIVGKWEKVPDVVTSITAPDKLTLVLGEEKQLEAHVNINAVNKELNYVSGDENIVKVDGNGMMSTVSEGKTFIKVISVENPAIYKIVEIIVTAISANNAKHYIVFGKTDKIGWYSVSTDGGKTFFTQFGNDHLEVEKGSEIIIKANGVFNEDPFAFYVNGKTVTPDENGCIRIVVDQYLLIGALSIPVPAPDVEESLNIFQQLIKSIKDFFAKLTSIFKF